MKKLFTILTALSLLCAVGCQERGDDNVNPNDKPNTEQPDDKPDDGEDDKPAPQEQHKIYVYNQSDWDPLYIYVWDKENLTEYVGKWCGTEMTESEEINGYTYLVYNLPKEADGRDIGVIFNNGEGSQTSDWFITLDKDYYLLFSAQNQYPTIIQDKNNPTENDFGDISLIPESHKIYYKSTDGEIVAPATFGVGANFGFGANFVSNTINSATNEGVIVFDGAVNMIGDWAFQECSNLASITIPDGVTIIGEGAFYYCTSLRSITIPDSVTLINDGAFYYCERLASITIPNNVTEIGNFVFANCSTLTNIIIPEGVTIIGEEAFSYCTSLTSITIPDSVTTIGEGAFSCCSKLMEFRGKFASNDGCALIVDGVFIAFASYCGLTEYTIPSGVTSIGKYAFCNCRLNSIIIPEGVTIIGEGAFNFCSSLTSITIPDSVTTIGKYAFGGCGLLTSIVIPESVTIMGEGAFNGCTSLPADNDGVIYVGKYLVDATNLQVSSYTIKEGTLFIGAGAFWGKENLTEITIPDSVISIEDQAFQFCSNLTRVVIPDSVTTLGWQAFTLCSSLSELVIGSGITTINSHTFYGCESLNSVVIPQNVTAIGNGAFSDCTTLQEVYCMATTPPDTIYSFDNNAVGRKIYVPSESVEAYKTHYGWSLYTDAIVGYNF